MSCSTASISVSESCFLSRSTEAERDQMMNTVAPFWDGNETWLVLGGVGLLVAFPVAYAILMPAFYLPVTLMLLGLVLRGVSFEFRWIAKTSKYLWNIAFARLDGRGLHARHHCRRHGEWRQSTGHAICRRFFDWLTPFNLMCGFAMIAGYALFGATWLMMKTEGEVAKHARKQAMIALYGSVFHGGGFALDAAGTSRALRSAGSRCRTSCSSGRCRSSRQCFRSCAGIGCRKGNDTMPFLCAIALFFMGYSGLVISNFPYLVPPTLDVWQTAAVPASQIFSLMGMLFMFPILVGYTILNYWVFRGKLKEGEGYH
jgi:cytochrome d ubiquinol oxidase subunit II